MQDCSIAGFTEDPDKEKDKDSLMKGGIPRNGCLTQWRRRGKREEKIPVSSSKALFRFSSPIGSFYRIGI